MIKAWLLFLTCSWFAVLTAFSSGAVEPAPASPGFNLHFFVRSYVLEGNLPPTTNSLGTRLAKHTGTNISLAEIVDAAADLQAECHEQGLPDASIAIAENRITNGIVRMYLFHASTPQILISGKRYFNGRDNIAIVAKSNETKSVDSKTNGETATNTGPHFAVNSYIISGNTLLRPETLKAVVFKHLGTNITVADILQAGVDLQKEYRERGYPTVGVTIPPQQISNGIVNIRVFEGRLLDIVVSHNHYFSSNNVMRAMPSLRTNVVLNGQVFQAELNRANANQDRQIYPRIEPGPQENTTILTLDIKDRIPIHGKTELNNESSPGTPDWRENTSAVYNNLWQLEHSLGVQYSFSPQRYKTGDNWNFYDLPMVANYSTFYRMPLSAPESLEDIIEAEPGSFGFSEATRKFALPPSSGAPELTIYASRSVIDSGVITSPVNLGNSSTNSGNAGTNSALPTFSSTADQQDLTVNQDLGARLTIPIRGTENFQSSVSGGLDFKTYDILSNKTNNFTLSYQTISENNTTNTVGSTNHSVVPLTHNTLQYLPLAFRYDATLRDAIGITTFGLGMSGNAWHSGGRKNVESITGSGKSTGYWFVLNPSVSRELVLITNWPITLRADGQWASEPLINNEQFGAGGVTSVRGYHEGEVFGDTGWHVSLEQKTAPHVVGFVSANNPLTVRGSIYMDYAEVYRMDPQGRPGSIDLWSVGVGGAATIGSHWEARFLLSLPLSRTSTVARYEPFFNFALNAQF